MGMATGLKNGSLINQTIPLGTASRAVVVVVVVIEVIVVPRILSHPKLRRFFDFVFDYDNELGG